MAFIWTILIQMADVQPVGVNGTAVGPASINPWIKNLYFVLGIRIMRYCLKHFASRGFIVIGTEEEESWDADAADKSLAFMLSENDDASSIFYHKVDMENIGVMGHSQGGAGVFNAITEMEHSDLYKAAVAVSPANEELAPAEYRQGCFRPPSADRSSCLSGFIEQSLFA